MKHVHAAASLCLISGAIPSALAGTNDWLNPADGSWLDPFNWSTGVVPGAGDDVRFEGPDASPEIYKVTDVGGRINSLTLAGRPHLFSTGTQVVGDVRALGSQAWLSGPLEVGGSLSVDAESSLVAYFGATATVHGPSEIEGALLVIDSEYSGRPQTSEYSFGHDLLVSGSLSIGIISNSENLERPARVRVAGDLTNVGTITAWEHSPGILEVQGELRNDVGGTIEGLNHQMSYRASVVNDGRVVAMTLGKEGADHVNRGSMWIGGTLTGDTLVNEASGSFGRDSQLGEFLFPAPEAETIDAVNHGLWASGGTFRSFAQSHGGEFTVRKWLPDSDQPFLPWNSPLLEVTDQAVLGGTLSVELVSLGSFQVVFGNRYTLLTAGTITGAFDDWNITGMPGHLHGVLEYTETSVSLLVVPTPSVSVIALLGLCAPMRTRRVSLVQ